ncbi:MAG: PEP-CTERM sorting domain-containing protein [Bryobacteraceae bacterium]|nr:PEP-CTERM sorting domain-containing protein [Bryobacteraceae bacterium]
MWALKPGTAALAAVAGLVLIQTASASLILVGPNPESGQGLGAVQTLLTIQGQGQDQIESGCISPTGSANCGFPDATVQSGANTTVRGINGVLAANLRFVFNGNEPGNDNLVTLNDLVITVYNGNTAIFSSAGLRNSNGTLVNPSVGLNFNPFSGTGNSGYLFRLTTAADNIPGDNQAGALQAILNGLGPNANLTVGIGALLSNASGGQETFSLRIASSGGDVPVPEPSTFALFGGSLILLGLLRRKRSA